MSIFENIMVFVGLSPFAGFAFFLAWLFNKSISKDSSKAYSNCQRTMVTVSHTIKHRDTRYQYFVNFRDYNGNDAVGVSEGFTESRTLKNGQVTEVFYWKEEETETKKQMEQFVDGTMNAMTITLFNKEYEPDLRPRYSIHFCDERIYSLERKWERKMSRVCMVIGCAILLFAVILVITR